MGWDKVQEVLPDAVAITWDGCHKIYVMMDDAQVDQQREYGYDPILPVGDELEALSTLEEWFDSSCGLRFISAVKSPGDNDSFTTLIGQFELDEDDEDRSGW